MLDYKLSSVEYYEFVLKNLPDETVESHINELMMNSIALVDHFLPVSRSKEAKTELFNLFLKTAANEKTSSNIKEKLIQNIYKFI